MHQQRQLVNFVERVPLSFLLLPWAIGPHPGLENVACLYPIVKVSSAPLQCDHHRDTFGNAESQNPTWTDWIRIYILTRSPRESHAQGHVRSARLKEWRNALEVPRKHGAGSRWRGMTVPILPGTWQETGIFRSAFLPPFSHILTPATATTKQNDLSAQLC